MERSRRRQMGQGGKQDVVLWLIVLERMASTLQDTYRLGVPVDMRPTLELFTAFRERVEEEPPHHPRYGPYTLPAFPGGPFAASRVLARVLARKRRLRLPDHRQLNGELTMIGPFPVNTLEEAEDLVELLVGRLVVLARYLAYELPANTREMSEDLRSAKSVSPEVLALMKRLFWEGLVEGVRPHIEHLRDTLDTLDELRANPVRWRYTREQMVKIQLVLAEHRATPVFTSHLSDHVEAEEENPDLVMN